MQTFKLKAKLQTSFPLSRGNTNLSVGACFYLVGSVVPFKQTHATNATILDASVLKPN